MTAAPDQKQCKHLTCHSLGCSVTPAQEEVTVATMKCIGMLVDICSQFSLCLFRCQVVDLNVCFCKKRNLSLSPFRASHNILPASRVVHVTRAELGGVHGSVTPINAPLPVHLYAVVCLHKRARSDNACSSNACSDGACSDEACSNNACSHNATLPQRKAPTMHAQIIPTPSPQIQKRNQCHCYQAGQRSAASEQRPCAMLVMLGQTSFAGRPG